jgi:Predicted membrane protein (DUF2142)
MPSAERRAALTLFILLVVPLVLLCAWRVPTGQVPDEPTHVARAASLLHGEVIGHRVAQVNAASGSEDAGVTANFGLVVAAFAGTGAAAPAPFDASPVTRLTWVRDIPWAAGPSFVSCVNTAAYAPIAYVPAALGLGVAMLLGAKPHGAIIAARFANAIAFSLIGIAALGLARRGRLLLLIVLALPMTIWLAGSCNQDGLVIAIAALGIALLTREERAAFWCGCAALAVLVLQKPPYGPLALLPLLTPGAADLRSLLRRLAGALVVGVPGLLWSMAVVALVAVPLLPSGLYHPGPLWPGDAARLFHSAISGAQLQVLLHHPWRVSALPFETAHAQLKPLRQQFIGVLGVLTVPLPHWLYQLWSVALLSALCRLAAGRASGAHWVTRVLAACAVLCCFELIFLTLYLTWTPVGMARIDGVQGRYFIPLAAAFVFVVPPVERLARLPRWIWWLAPVAAILATGATLPPLIAAYYTA